MALLNRDEWYDLVRTTNWTPKYVAEDALFPEQMSGARGIPMAVWETYDEPYKTTYPEYVSIQREKDSGTYSIKAALERAAFVDQADPGWVSTMLAHYGAIPLGEYVAGIGEARMARFSKAPGNRNMAVFGMMDENRHAQLQLFFRTRTSNVAGNGIGRTKRCGPTSGRRSRRARCSTISPPLAMRFRPRSC